jgi:AbrB family looped-hinge helix DNA binding protein
VSVTVKRNAPIIVPPSVRRRAGIKPGDTLEFRASGGVITIIAKPDPDDDGYTTAQRRTILADAKAGLKEIEDGKFFGPFETGAQLGAFVEREVRKEEAKNRKLHPK